MIKPIEHLLNIDLANKINMNKSIIIKKNDTDSHKFVVNIFNSGVNYDLTDTTAKIYFKKTDGTKVFLSCVYDSILKNRLSVLLTTQSLTNAGNISCEITIYGTNKETLTSNTFNFNVTENIRDDSAIESTNEFSALVDALAVVTTISNKADKTYTDAQLLLKANAISLTATNTNVTNNKAEFTTFKGNTESQLANITQHDLKVVFITDMHLNSVSYMEMLPNDRINFMIQCLNDEHESKPIDMVIITGDMASNTPFGNTEKLITDYLPKLLMPYYCLKGNHDLITDESWKSLLGYDKNYSISYGENAFICLNNFGGELDTSPIEFGNFYKKTDMVWFNEQVAKFTNKKIFICCHYLDEAIDSELVDIINSTTNIIAVFQGHTHLDVITTLREGGKPKINCGHFSLGANNIQEPWRYRILEEVNNQITTKMVYPAKIYPTFTQLYQADASYLLIDNPTISETLSLLEINANLLNSINSRNLNVFTKLKKLDTGKSANTSGLLQTTFSGIIDVRGDATKHIDTLYHTGMYYVDTANVAPYGGGFLIVTGYGSGNYSQMLILTNYTRPIIQFRSRISGNEVSVWSNLEPNTDVSDLFVLQTGFTEISYAKHLAKRNGKFVTVSGLVQGTFATSYASNQALKIDASINPIAMIWGTANLLTTAGVPYGHAVARVNTNGFIEFSIPSGYTGGIAFTIEYKIS